ncbi:MAG: hypothetical protein V3V23_01640 [Dehalococcoidales bacterium]
MTEQREIDPFISDEVIIKDPERICEYEEIEAACNHLLVYLYRRDDAIKVPTRNDIIGLDKVLTIIKANSGIIVGQIPGLAMIQVEVTSEEELLNLKRLLSKSPYVKSVSYNMTAVFE